MYWNKTTRNDQGNYCRHGNWGLERIPRRLENFTEIEPPKEAYEGMPVDWNEVENKWDYDLESFNAKKELKELDDQGELNRTVEEIVDALAIAAPEVYALISEYGKVKIAERKVKREKI